MSGKQAITIVTPEQQALIPIYRDRWKSIDVSTQRIDYPVSVDAVRSAYSLSSYPEPEIVYYESPFAAINDLVQVKSYCQFLGNDISSKFDKRVVKHLASTLNTQVDKDLLIKLRNQVQYPKPPHYPTLDKPQAPYFPTHILQCIEHQLLDDLEELVPQWLENEDVSLFTRNLYRPAQLTTLGCEIDFCISVLGLHCDKAKWNVFQSLVKSCGILLLFEKVCVVCERPSSLFFDENNALHSEDSPSLQFPDGYSVYAQHGQVVPRL
jgi:hypothetical protein